MNPRYGLKMNHFQKLFFRVKMPQKPPKLTKKALRKPKINIKHKNNTPQIYIFIPETFLKNSKIQKTPYLKKKPINLPKNQKKPLRRSQIYTFNLKCWI